MSSPGYMRQCAAPDCVRLVGPKGGRGWCTRHYQRWLATGHPLGTLRPSTETRFFEKVAQDGDCWIWTASKDQSGYGLFSVGTDKSERAHRWCYRFMVGEIPVGLELDHLCRVRACVNPGHLDPVTPLVNYLRGDTTVNRTHCPQGHPYDPENTYRHPAGKRVCRTCSSASRARYEMRRKGLAA